jgi:hypothetical protein
VRTACTPSSLTATHHLASAFDYSHYDFSTLEGPVRKALQDWADHVAAITGQGVTGTNVVELVKVRRSAVTPSRGDYNPSWFVTAGRTV